MMRGGASAASAIVWNVTAAGARGRVACGRVCVFVWSSVGFLSSRTTKEKVSRWCENKKNSAKKPKKQLLLIPKVPGRRPPRWFSRPYIKSAEWGGMHVWLLGGWSFSESKTQRPSTEREGSKKGKGDTRTKTGAYKKTDSTASPCATRHTKGRGRPAKFEAVGRGVEAGRNKHRHRPPTAAAALCARQRAHVQGDWVFSKMSYKHKKSQARVPSSQQKNMKRLGGQGGQHSRDLEKPCQLSGGRGRTGRP